MYLAKVLTIHTLPEIGRRFGGKDHTTVLNATRKITWLIGDNTFPKPLNTKAVFNSDPALRDLVKELKRELTT
jgi:hypothetical protein